MKRRMLKLIACFLMAVVLSAGQASCSAIAEEENVVISDEGGETATEKETERVTEQETEKKKKKKKKKKKTTQTEETSASSNMKGQMIFARCEEHINIRKGPGIDSDVIGKIYNDCMATVLSEDGAWYEINSGNATGFVKAEYFATGAEAEAIAEAVAYHVATVYADELNIRALPDDDSEVIGVAYKGEELEAVAYEDDWIKVALGDDVYGYLNAYYAGYDTYYPEAETLEEEQARLEAEYAEEEYEEDAPVEETYVSYTPEANGGTSDQGGYTQAPAQTVTQPETQAQTQPETQAQTQLETQAQTQPETQAQTQPETQAQTQPETQAETSAPEEQGDDDSEEEYEGDVNDDEYYDASTGQMVKF